MTYYVARSDWLYIRLAHVRNLKQVLFNWAVKGPGF